jgi:hypothetical protein
MLLNCDFFPFFSFSKLLLLLLLPLLQATKRRRSVCFVRCLVFDVVVCAFFTCFISSTFSSSLELLTGKKM